MVLTTGVGAGLWPPGALAGDGWGATGVGVAAGLFKAGRGAGSTSRFKKLVKPFHSRFQKGTVGVLTSGFIRTASAPSSISLICNSKAEPGEAWTAIPLYFSEKPPPGRAVILSNWGVFMSRVVSYHNQSCFSRYVSSLTHPYRAGPA